MTNWAENVQKFYQLDEAEQLAEWAKLDGQQRAAFVDARAALNDEAPVAGTSLRDAATQHRRGSGRSFRKILLLGGLLLGAILLLRDPGGSELLGTAAPQSGPETLEPTGKAGKSEIVSGSELDSLIDETLRSRNSLAINRLWDGRIAEIEGAFWNLTTDESRYYVFLDSGSTLNWTFGELQALWLCQFLPGDRRVEEALSALDPGERVTFRGNFTFIEKAQGELVYRVVFDNCSIK